MDTTKLIKWIQEIYPNLTDSKKKEIEEIFPEFKESEDERIRTKLISQFKALNTLEVWGGIKRADIIACLERQGELISSLTKGLDNAHERIDELIQKNNKLISQLEEKQGEQNLAECSEKDKRFIKELCDLLVSIAKNGYVGKYYAPDLVCKLNSICSQKL